MLLKILVSGLAKSVNYLYGYIYLEQSFKDAVIKELDKQTLLGSGCFSAVFNSTVPNRVKKIGVIDDEWLTYYENIIKGSKNPCIPIVDSVTYYEGYYVAIIERLTELSRTAEAILCERYATGKITSRTFMYEARQAVNVILYPEYLKDLLDEIKDLLVDGTKIDMHSSNFLYRDGALVVSDPLADYDIQIDVDEWLHDEILAEEYA
jgi:hypothetical protein